MRRAWMVALLVALCAAGCARGASTEQKVADGITQAAYNNDIAGVQNNLDSALAPQVTRTSVALLSDKMHSLGAYQGLTETATDIPTRHYTFDAKFEKGDMTVRMRFDPDGKVAGYIVTPGTPH